ncbi:cytochrome P450 [Pseudonocardia endophytica]|uniref:Pulcherriminic acid synthase n=1 Tax=Pseudonocardia endophytica TaxID=401976 RepID=A0A4R1HMY6_PSEEN|nr:cytochrome P450 [Pseudonocardia endophytica]TCK21935.1 pulcherriminic acid synthase [Pseudonocardia endophytica]
MTVSTPAPPDLLSQGHIADPWPGLAVLRDHYPVHFDEGLGVWLISRYEDVRRLANLDIGGLAQELLGQYLADTQAFFAMDGIDHRRRRALVTPVLARSSVQRFADQVDKHAHALLDPIFERERAAVKAGERDRAEIDFVTEFTASFSANVMIQILDLPIPDHTRMSAWFAAWINAEGNITGDSEIIAKAQQAKAEFSELILPVIQERRNGTGEDLITRLCRAELDGISLSDAEIQSFVATMFLAGGETTDHQLGWVMHELAVNPDVQHALAADRGLMANVLAESMRFHAIIPFGSRPAPAGFEVGGVHIEEGAQLAVMYAAANHDPRRFENPDTFDIHRADLDPSKAFNGAAQHLGFGSGPHFCIGSHLTKAEMETALNVFLEHAHDVRIADGFEPTPNPESPFVRSLPSLKLSFELT